jgi:hypothetical protein
MIVGSVDIGKKGVSKGGREDSRLVKIYMIKMTDNMAKNRRNASGRSQSPTVTNDSGVELEFALSYAPLAVAVPSLHLGSGLSPSVPSAVVQVLAMAIQTKLLSDGGCSHSQPESFTLLYTPWTSFCMLLYCY